MAYQDPNAPVIARFFATRPDGKRIEIKSDPGNQIEFFTGEPAETLPGVLEVDYDGATEYFVRLDSPSTAVGSSQLYLMSDPVNGLTYGRVSADIFDFFSPIVGFPEADLILEQQRIRPTNPVWTNLALSGTWATSGGLTPQYYVDATDNVHVVGRVAGGGAGAVGTLPAGARPVKTLDFALKANNDAGTIAWVTIGTNGVITVVGNFAAAQVQLCLTLSFNAII